MIEKYGVLGTIGFLVLMTSGFIQRGNDVASVWRELLVKEGGFSILFPHNSDSPEYFDGELQTRGRGGKIAAHTFGGHDADVKYAVVYSILPAGVRSTLWNDIRRTILTKQARGKILSQRTILLDGHPGVEYKAATKQEDEVIRIYLVKERRYVLRVVAPRGKMILTDLSKFLDSFKLTTG